jgi:hypothetical protein
MWRFFHPMRKIPNIIRLLICSLLIGGYGAMYAGSVVHDLGHMGERALHAQAHSDSALAAHDEASHLEVSCFFCSHGPVLAASNTIEQAWTLDVSPLVPPFEIVRSLHSSSVSLRELRGPPAV